MIVILGIDTCTLIDDLIQILLRVNMATIAILVIVAFLLLILPIFLFDVHHYGGWLLLFVVMSV
jgi:hypothetical protein